jgi:uncharacterized protein (TIGR02594 family)
VRYGWFLRGKRSKKFYCGGNAVETAAQATMFATADEARAHAAGLMMAPELEVVDYAILPPPPPDADKAYVPTRDELIRAAKIEDQAREAERRATWTLIPKAVAAFAAAIAASLLVLGYATPATASPRDNLFPPTIGAHAHDGHRASHIRPERARPFHVAGRSAGPRVLGGDSRQHGEIADDRSSFGWARPLQVAERYLGTNPTGRASLWCADFANLVERQIGRAGTNSREALSFLRYGPHVAPYAAAPGDLVVLGRKGGGHVGFLVKQTPAGPLIISGNHGHRVGVGVYPASRVIAYVRPS